MADYAGQPSSFYASTGGTPQEGAWYSGRQYSNGQLGAPGVKINAGPGQGQKVSNEVIAQTNPKNVGYINAGAPVSSGSGSSQSVLDSFQGAASSAMGGVSIDASKSDEQILAEVKGQLTPSTPQPTPPNLEQTYQTFLNAPGIGGSSVNQLSGQLTDINKQIADTQSALEAQKTNEELSGGGKVPLSVIAGRQTEEQRLAQVKLDSLSLQKGVLVEQINMQTQNINTLMQLTEQDYTNASQAWQQEFDVNAKIYDAFQTQVQNRNDLAIKLQGIAATNLQTMMNLITSGNMSYGNLSPDQKLQVTQMETQAGLPAGTMSQVQMSAKDRLLNVSNYRGQVTAIMAGPDGQITTQKFGNMEPLAGSAGLKALESSLQPQFANALQKVSSSGNNQGHVDPKNWNGALNDWVAQGGSEKSFVDNFKQYTDPHRSDFETAYGISLSQRGITPSAENASNYYGSP